MKRFQHSEYVTICIYYRIFSIILATIVYFMFALQIRELNAKKVLVAVGMLSACFLGTFLYKMIIELEIKTVWIYIMILIEAFSYGIFIFLSGGFYSPFLWYCIGSLFLPMSLNKCKPIVFVAAAWYIVCTVANRMVPSRPIEPINLEINTAIGVVIVFAAFYVLVSYIRKLDENQKKTEQALNHITDLYDSFHLFTMSDIDKIMLQLISIIKRTVAPAGGLLIKFNEEGEPEWHQSIGMINDELYLTVDWKNVLEHHEEPFDIEIENEKYWVFQIGNPLICSGLLIRPGDAETVKDAETNDFYYKLIDIVFKNIDVQKQLEEFIIGEEQKRIADEIHDTVIQKLFGIACKLKILETSYTGGEEEELKAELRALKVSVELAMKELRETIYGKRFTDQNKQLHEKLKTYMAEVEKLWDTQIMLNLDKDSELLPVSHKIAIYKTVCEAVNNAIRHGAAKRVNVDVKIGPDGIHTVISDNGNGFVAGAKKSNSREGNGLKNMQRLAKAFKGNCFIDSTPGEGTQVTLYLPR